MRKNKKRCTMQNKNQKNGAQNSTQNERGNSHGNGADNEKEGCHGSGCGKKSDKWERNSGIFPAFSFFLLQLKGRRGTIYSTHFALTVTEGGLVWPRSTHAISPPSRRFLTAITSWRYAWKNRTQCKSWMGRGQRRFYRKAHHICIGRGYRRSLSFMDSQIS